MSGQANFRTIQAEVLRRVREREWPPGALIPGETTLAEEFDCARATINRALRELADKGILDRKRRAGTRVSLNPTRKASFDIPVIRLEIEAQGAIHDHRVLWSRRAKMPRALAARLGLPNGRAMLHHTTLHSADGQPYLYEDRWVQLSVMPAILSAPLDRISANEWLVQNAPFSHGNVAFFAERASGSQAKALECDVGDALLGLERTTWSGSDLITYVRMAYRPGHRFETVI